MNVAIFVLFSKNIKIYPENSASKTPFIFLKYHIN